MGRTSSRQMILCVLQHLKRFWVNYTKSNPVSYQMVPGLGFIYTDLTGLGFTFILNSIFNIKEENKRWYKSGGFFSIDKLRTFLNGRAECVTLRLSWKIFVLLGMLGYLRLHQKD